MKILAIDFDNTIAEAVEPYDGSIGEMFEDADYYINKLSNEGYYIIIWTCRGDIALVDVINWLNNKCIMYDSINENAPMDILGFKPLPKVYADVYIDDKCLGGLPLNKEGKPDWNKIYNIVKESV